MRWRTTAHRPGRPRTRCDRCDSRRGERDLTIDRSRPMTVGLASAPTRNANSPTAAVLRSQLRARTSNRRPTRACSARPHPNVRLPPPTTQKIEPQRLCAEVSSGCTNSRISTSVVADDHLQSARLRIHCDRSLRSLDRRGLRKRRDGTRDRHQPRSSRATGHVATVRPRAATGVRRWRISRRSTQRRRFIVAEATRSWTGVCRIQNAIVFYRKWTEKR